MNLSKNCQFAVVNAPVAAGSSIDDNSSILDMSGWDGVIFAVTIDDSVATGVATLTVEQNSANSGSGMAALAGAVATAICSTNDDLNGNALVVDVYKPRERYLQGVITSATANIAFGSTIAILYKSRGKLPASAHSTILQQALAVSPAES